MFSTPNFKINQIMSFTCDSNSAKKEMRERCANFTDAEKWKFIELFEQNKDVLMSPDRKPRSFQIRKETWQHIAYQINSTNKTGQIRTVAQLHHLWKNLTCRAKSKLNEFNLNGTEMTPMDVKVLSLLDEANGSTYTTITPQMDKNIGSTNSNQQNSNSGISDWDHCINAIKSESFDEDFECEQQRSSSAPQQASEQIVAASSNKCSIASALKFAAANSSTAETTFGLSSGLETNDQGVPVVERAFYVEMMHEQRMNLTLKRKKLEAKLLQIDVKNRLLQCEIEANEAKKIKYQQEARNIHLQNLDLIRKLEYGGVSSDCPIINGNF